MRKSIVIISNSTLINRNTTLSGSNSIGPYSTILNSSIGFGTYIGRDCDLSNCEIGNYSSIGNNIVVLTNNHPVSGFVSTHPAFHRATHPLMKKLDLSFSNYDLYPENKYTKAGVKVSIGSDVWIGNDVKILSGLSIGDGAVIATGAIVTKDVPPYSISGGIPAKHIKYRFTKDKVNWLLDYKWWYLPKEILKNNYEVFSNIDDLLKSEL
jgi:acetyltransferase-like isoleucine patch superfamily enzyme